MRYVFNNEKFSRWIMLFNIAVLILWCYSLGERILALEKMNVQLVKTLQQVEEILRHDSIHRGHGATIGTNMDVQRRSNTVYEASH